MVGGHGQVAAYDYREDAWRELCALPSRRSSARTAKVGSQLWVIGGEVPYKGRTASILALDTAELAAPSPNR